MKVWIYIRFFVFSIFKRCLAAVMGTALAVFVFSLLETIFWKDANMITASTATEFSELILILSFYTIFFGLIPSIIIDSILYKFRPKSLYIRGFLYVLSGTLLAGIGNILALGTFLSLVLLEKKVFNGEFPNPFDKEKR